jgi:vaccinia related kinase
MVNFAVVQLYILNWLIFDLAFKKYDLFSQLDALEYIHSKGYAHADVKGSNILLSYGNEIGKEKSKAYLVDYGLAYRFRTTTGEHKPFIHDERRAHEGTLEFTSRDAHHGSMLIIFDFK